MLGRDLSCAEELLSALVSVGLLERSDGRYLAIPATVAYCRAVRAGLFDAAGEPRD
jgi:hypothetical protein